WLVRDGDVLYVDRNGNGDLTEKGERHAATRDQGGISWRIGDIVEAGGRARHTDLHLRFRSGSFLLSVRTAERVRQEVGNELGRLQFSDRSQDAPVVHLAGPLTFLLPGPPALTPGEEPHFTALVGTAGLGEGATTYSHVKDFEKLQMVGEVEFPGPAPGARL